MNPTTAPQPTEEICLCGHRHGKHYGGKRCLGMQTKEQKYRNCQCQEFTPSPASEAAKEVNEAGYWEKDGGFALPRAATSKPAGEDALKIGSKLRLTKDIYEEGEDLAPGRIARKGDIVFVKTITEYGIGVAHEGNPGRFRLEVGEYEVQHPSPATTAEVGSVERFSAGNYYISNPEGSLCKFEDYQALKESLTAARAKCAELKTQNKALSERCEGLDNAIRSASGYVASAINGDQDGYDSEEELMKAHGILTKALSTKNAEGDTK